MLQCKSSEQPLCSFVSEIWNNNGKVDQSFFERFEQNGLTINRFSADCGLCPVIMLTQMCSRLILDNAFNLWVRYCVLPRVALWGKGMKVGRSGCFSLNLSDNSVMRERVRARRTLKDLGADLREITKLLRFFLLLFFCLVILRYLYTHNI